MTRHQQLLLALLLVAAILTIHPNQIQAQQSDSQPVLLLLRDDQPDISLSDLALAIKTGGGQIVHTFPPPDGDRSPACRGEYNHGPHAGHR